MALSISAPAKLIVCGEHAVVYGQPALAMPFSTLRATVTAERAARGAGLTLHAADLDQRWRLHDDEPLPRLAQRTLTQLGIVEPDALLTVRSTIPPASGMGSGAAVATALVRTLAALSNQHLPDSAVSDLVYESERHFHGTPSGIDNTVIAYEQPIFFQRQADHSACIRRLDIAGPWHWVIGDTGVRSETKAVVANLRQRAEADWASYAPIFAAIGTLVRQLEAALAGVDGPTVGALLNANHAYLRELALSAPPLERLVAAAQHAGAWGSKLSGAGWGGSMLALVAPERSEQVAQALRAAGASQTWITTLARTS